MKQILTMLIIFAIAASAWQIREVVVKTQHTSAEAQRTSVQVHQLTVENHALVTSLQAAIVESCRKNGNASRKVTRETIEEEKHELEHPDPEVIAALNISPDLLTRITRENIKKLDSRLSRTHSVNCAEQYKISPGSGDRRRDQSDSSR